MYTVLIGYFFVFMGIGRQSFNPALFVSRLTLFAIVPAVIGFYSFYTLLFRSLSRKKIAALLVTGIITAVIGATLVMLLLYALSGSRYIFHDGWNSAIEETFFMAILVLVNGTIALVMKGFILWYEGIKEKEELSKRNHDMEMELVKMQLDPHFLFNTINNIDVLITKDAIRASEYLNKLSDIMRFMLYDTKSAKVLLSKELNYIQKYIDLQKIRNPNPEFVSYKVEGTAEESMVPTMLFIPFIENAFKHADNKKEGTAIRICIRIRKDMLAFECTNRYNLANGVIEKGGIGNELIQRRLKLIYPGHHDLNIFKEQDVYTVKLIIQRYAD